MKPDLKLFKSLPMDIGTEGGGGGASAMWVEEAGHFRKVIGLSIIVVGGLRFVTDTLTIDS